MTNYKKPDVGQNIIISNSHRYCIIDLQDPNGFDGLKKDVADYLYFDKKYGATAATIEIIENGKYELFVMLQAGMSKIYENINDLIINAPKFVQMAFRSIIGK